MFNNASTRSAIECFLPERKCSPRCLQALAILIDRCQRCIARKSKIVRDYARNIFRFDFLNGDVCFFVWTYEMEQFRLKVGSENYTPDLRYTMFQSAHWSGKSQRNLVFLQGQGKSGNSSKVREKTGKFKIMLG